MKGRKPLYTPETLEIGEKMELSGKAKKFKDQYLYQFNKRGANKYKSFEDGKKVFIERIL